MKIIAICGLPGSGKSTAIEAIKDFGIVVSMGDIVRNEAKKKNIAPTGKNLGKIAKNLREKNGAGIIAQKCLSIIEKLKEDVIFVDGIRSLDEVNIFRKHWKFPIIAIIVDEKKRLKWLVERARSDDPKNFKEIEERDRRELKFGLDDILKNADYELVNDSTIENLKQKTKELILNILEDF
ncbi:hypothetical protein LCGC14_0404860 [marine sediment metagenome]|uniref:Dephospho-CoA kinase n=1 Tax=marine sediment metagenome TaxID=412755 RepID=A0A0F9VHP6_9ZZZZ|nr:MAG: Dephospho-CoA kinase [Candidatus Lokiarchaeum sp. GC14_75]